MESPPTPNEVESPPDRGDAREFPRSVTWAAVAIVIAALYFGRPVLIPIALAILLSFLLAPVAQRFERWGLGRIPSVLVTVLGATALAVTVGWFVAGQMHELTEKLPEYKGTLHAKFVDLRARFGGPVERATDIVQEIGGTLDASAEAPGASGAVRVQLVDRASDAAAWMSSILGRIVELLGVSALIALFVTFMLLQREALRDRLIWLLGHQRLHVTTQMLEEASGKVSQYLLAQLVINATQGVLVGIGLAVIGVPDSLLWGMMAALLRFLPYVGPWVAAVCPILVSFAVFDGWTKPLETMALFIVLETVSNNVFEPWIYGVKTGLSSLAIIVAAVFWTFLWGGVGLLLSTPLTVCLVVMGKYIPQLRAISVLLGDQAVLSRAARLYQRLLAADFEGAWDLLRPELESKTLLEVYDSTMLPALSLAAQDCRGGTLEEDRREFIEQSLEQLVAKAAESSAAAEVPSPTPETPRAGQERAPKLLCLPASDALDEIAARMLREVLRQDQIDCEVASVVLFAGEMLDLVTRHEANVVCVSHLQPPALTPTRYLCKRLMERHADVPIVVGAWSADEGVRKADLRLPRQGNFHVASSLREARAHAQRLLEAVRLDLRTEAEGAAEQPPARILELPYAAPPALPS